MMQYSNTIRRTVRLQPHAASMLLCLAALTPSLMAQVSSYGDKQTGPANDKPPAILERRRHRAAPE